MLRVRENVPKPVPEPLSAAAIHAVFTRIRAELGLPELRQRIPASLFKDLTYPLPAEVERDTNLPHRQALHSRDSDLSVTRC